MGGCHVTQHNSVTTRQNEDPTQEGAKLKKQFCFLISKNTFWYSILELSFGIKVLLFIYNHMVLITDAGSLWFEQLCGIEPLNHDPTAKMHGFYISRSSIPRFRAYTQRTGHGQSRLVRGLINSIPWDNPDLELALMCIPRDILHDPVRLSAWLSNASNEVIEHYCGVPVSQR